MLSAWKVCCGRVPQRLVFAVMGFLAILNAYGMRVCLSIALTQMVKPGNETVTENGTSLENTCSAYPEDHLVEHKRSGTYEWTKEEQGTILSAFYWGYVITHLPGGLLAERFGGKYSLGLGILSTAVTTLLTPIAVDYGGATALIILRFVMGLGEGTTYPALNSMLAQWTPPEERSKLGSLVFAGALLGTVFGTSVSGVILQDSQIGWPAVFYVFGFVGVLWFVIWTILCYNNPDEHPFISERELKYLHDRMSAHTHKKPPLVPWRHMFTSIPFWALVAAQIGHDWGFFTMVTDLPTYMNNVMKFSIKNNGYLSSLPYLCMWISSLISSWLADKMITSGFMSRTNVRKLGTTIASIGPGAFLVGASYAECDRTIVVVMFTVGMTLMGTFYPGMKVNGLDLSPNYSGSLMAIVNGMGAFTGIITPLIVRAFTPNGLMTEWRLVFWVVFGVFVVTNLIFVLFASGEVQEWNDPDFIRRDKEERRRKHDIEKQEKTEKKVSL